MREENGADFGDDPARSQADELLEQFGELLDEFATDSAEVAEFYQKHQQVPEFQELADSLLALLKQSESEAAAAARRRSLMPLALLTMACVPAALFAVIVYVASASQGRMAALAETVGRQIPALEQQLADHASTSRRMEEVALALEKQATDQQKKMETWGQQLGETAGLIKRAVMPPDSASGIQWVQGTLPKTMWPTKTPSGLGSSGSDATGGPDVLAELAESSLAGTVQLVSSRDSAYFSIPLRTTKPGPIVDGIDADRRIGAIRPAVEKRFYLYEDDAEASKFSPTAWMPDGNGIAQDTQVTDSPQSGEHCIRLYCELTAKEWVGVYWLLQGTWEPTERFNLFEELDATMGDPIRCRFWARSKDAAVVQFRVGGVTMGKIGDSLEIPVGTPPIKLEPDWKMYEIDLTGKDVSSVVGGFLWACNRKHNGSNRDITFDLDTIYFVKLGAESAEEEYRTETEVGPAHDSVARAAVFVD
jgi:hypothetical protein